MSTKCLTTIPQGSRAQANGARNARDLVNQDRDIVSSAWRRAAVNQKTVEKLRFSAKILSCDAAVGLPFNLIQYHVLLRLVALWLDVTPGIITYTLNDVHVYEAHNQQRLAMLDAPTHTPPDLTFDLTAAQVNLDNWRQLDAATALHHVTMRWFKIENYKHSGKLLFNVAV